MEAKNPLSFIGWTIDSKISEPIFWWRDKNKSTLVHLKITKNDRLSEEERERNY